MNDNDNWRQRWEEGRTGWHRNDVHPTLAAHFNPAWRRVLVPLCGATIDLDFIANQGAKAVGIDLSEIAARRVFERRGTPPEVVATEHATRFSATGITIFVGDIFETTPELVGAIDAVWDRAAMVAIDPSRRDAYVALLRDLAPDADLLLDVFDYAPHFMDGPPHAISDAYVRGTFEAAEQLDEESVDDSDGAFVRRAYRIRL